LAAEALVDESAVLVDESDLDLAKLKENGSHCARIEIKVQDSKSEMVKKTLEVLNFYRLATHTPSSYSCFDMNIFQVSQWEALLKELAWDGSYTQKRLWPRTGTAGVIATKLQETTFLMLKESTQLRTGC